MLSSGSPTTGASGATRTGVVPPTVGPSVPPLHWGCSNGGTADRDVPAVLADDFARRTPSSSASGFSVISIVVGLVF